MYLGAVLPIHIEVSSQSREVEEGLVSVLKKVVRMISVKDFPADLSEDQRNRAAVLLSELQAVIVGAQLVRSVRLLMYVSTLEVLESVSATFMTGELAAVFRQLFCCLMGISDITVAVSIQAEDLQGCKDELGFVGMLLLLI